MPTWPLIDEGGSPGELPIAETVVESTVFQEALAEWPRRGIEQPTIMQYGPDSGGPGLIVSAPVEGASPTVVVGEPQTGDRDIDTDWVQVLAHPDDDTIFTINTMGNDHDGRLIFRVQEAMSDLDEYIEDDAERVGRAAAMLRILLHNDRLIFRHPDMTEVSDAPGEAAVADYFDEDGMYTHLVLFGFHSRRRG